MNERAVDHLTVMVINCSIVAAMVFLIMNDHPWWALLFAFCFTGSSKCCTDTRDDAASPLSKEKP